MDNDLYTNTNSLSDDTLISILNNVENVDDIRIEIHKLNLIIYKLDINIFKKILLNINFLDLRYIFKNSVDDTYLHKHFNFWDNNNCFVDFIDTIQNLADNGLLYLINSMDVIKFKLNISSLKFYQIKLIYPFIKGDNVKFKILINSIDEDFLMCLINDFDDKSIKFLNLNYNFIFRFNQIATFATASISEISEMNVTKLQIILLLETSNENKIKHMILNHDFIFIKKIINYLNPNTFIYIIKKLQLNMIYDLINILKLDHLIILLPHINDEILHIFCVKLNIDMLYKLVEFFTIDQFISCLYYITDDKLECVKNMNHNHKHYFENLFNLINFNLYEDYISHLSKQLIFCLLQTNCKNTILQNCKYIHINIIKIIINYLNYHDIIDILNKYNIEERTNIITSIHADRYQMISNFIDDTLSKSSIDRLSVNNKINFNIFYNFIHLHLSLDSNNKIKQILNINNV
jgi:hypothetical protein